MNSQIDNIFAFGAQQQTDAYNRIAAYKEQQAAHELLAAQTQQESMQHILQHTKQNLRPSVLMRVHLSREEGEWVAAHGECRGRGPTPDLACLNFDANWVGKKE